MRCTNKVTWQKPSIVIGWHFDICYTACFSFKLSLEIYEPIFFFLLESMKLIEKVLPKFNHHGPQNICKKLLQN